MKLNEKCNLVMRSIYSYDISACHYNILKNNGFDISHLDKDDKTKRNIQIGQMMRGNPDLTKFLRETTESIISEYIAQNDLSDDEIVIRQYDGFLSTRMLNVTEIGAMPLDKRDKFTIFISSIDRRMYIAKNSFGETTVKGVPFMYDQMKNIYASLCATTDASDKNIIFKRLQYFKDQFLLSNNTLLFGIPTGKENRFNVFLKKYGELEVSGSTLKIMDLEDIDRIKYFEFYIEPFTKSIVYQFVR